MTSARGGGGTAVDGFLDPGYSYRVPPHVQAAISRLKLARNDLLSLRPYESMSRLHAEMIAGTIDRAIAELKGEPVRYPALEAENAT